MNQSMLFLVGDRVTIKNYNGLIYNIDYIKDIDKVIILAHYKFVFDQFGEQVMNIKAPRKFAKMLIPFEPEHEIIASKQRTQRYIDADKRSALQSQKDKALSMLKLSNSLAPNLI
jgi:hypothetical protein